MFGSKVVLFCTMLWFQLRRAEGPKDLTIILTLFSHHFGYFRLDLFLLFLTRLFVSPIFLGGEREEGKMQKITQFSRHFKQFWTCWIFFPFATQGGGALGIPKDWFPIDHLVRYNYAYTQNIRPLQPFLLENSTLWHTDTQTDTQEYI